MGVAGAGMSALAEAFARAGITVSGCDARTATEPTLAALGVVVSAGHDPAHAELASALVVTAAIPDDHPEIAAARARGIPVLKRARALGEWVSSGRLVGVAGTHGKTSTTAMCTHVLEAAGLDPTGFVGGRVAAWNSNLRPGADDLFVVEADEYDRSFLHLSPDVAIVTNVEADHLDIYGDAEGVDDAFRAYVARIRPGGCLVACADDRGTARLMLNAEAEVVTYGTSSGSEIRAVDVHMGPQGSRFRIEAGERDHGVFTLSAPGLHNVRNALGAAGAARALDVPWDAVRAGLAAYQGVGRRFERLADVGGVVVVDDYAHHPTEVRATLTAARRAYPDHRLIAVFQPHLFSRTRDFHEEFGGALALADEVWVTDVYPAREAPIPGVDGALVARAVTQAGGRVHYHASLDDLANQVYSLTRAGDLVLTLGAGSIERVGPQFVDLLTSTHESVESTQ